MGEVSRRIAGESVGTFKVADVYTLSPEAAAVLDASPDIQILLASDQTILFANAAFHATNPDEAGPLVGQSLSASLMGLDAARAASRQLILDAVRLALESGRTVRTPPFRYDVQKDLGRSPRDAWWSLSAAPFQLNGQACLLVTAREETAGPSGPRASSDRAPEPEQAEPLIWSERRRLGQMFDQCADMMSLVVGPDHVFELINPALKRAAGRAQLLGRSMREIVRSDAGRQVVQRLDEVRATGQPYVARALPFRMTVEDEEDRFLDLTFQPLIDEGGRVEAIFCRGQDVTDHVRAQAVQSFLREELAHRQGNILAVVLALAEQSAARATSLDAFKSAFAARLSALSTIHSLLNRAGPDIALDALAGAIARTSRCARPVFRGVAPVISPRAAITLGLMLHELFQVSSNDDHQTSTPARIRAHTDAHFVRLFWRGRADDEFWAADDFGRRLIDHAVRHEFRGEWSVRRRGDVLSVRFQLPRNHQAWAPPGPTA